MTTRNMTCVGTHCEAPHGELRIYRRLESVKDGVSDITNIILCHACWQYENAREGKRPVEWLTAPVHEQYSGSNK